MPWHAGGFCSWVTQCARNFQGDIAFTAERKRTVPERGEVVGRRSSFAKCAIAAQRHNFPLNAAICVEGPSVGIPDIAEVEVALDTIGNFLR